MYYLSERYRISLTEFAAWRVDISRTLEVGSGRNTRMAIKVKGHGQCHQKLITFTVHHDTY